MGLVTTWTLQPLIFIVLIIAGSTVLVSIFINNSFEHYLSAVLVCVVRVIEFSTSILVHEHCKWYVPRMYTCTHIHTYASSTMSQHSGAETKSIPSKFHIVQYMCSGHVVTFVCLFSAPPGGEVWEANMEETGEGCGGPRRRWQLCSGPGNSKRALWCVTIATLPYSISTSLVLDHVKVLAWATHTLVIAQRQQTAGW